MSGIGSTVKKVFATGDALVDGLLYGTAWSGPVITYAFPDDPVDYSYQKETQAAFAAASSLQVKATLFALEQSSGNVADDGFSVEGFTNVTLSLGAPDTANLRVAQSSAPSTSYTYMPDGVDQAGDVWFGRRFDYTTAQPGNYAWHTILHEIGHALGLKHGNDAVGDFDALPGEYDSLEYTVMTYRSYQGGSDTEGYSYSQWSAPQTYMMGDIAALQHIYGADFNTNSGDTTYRWSQTSGDTFVNGKLAIDAGSTVIFATIWDGGGTDTYDLSDYTSDLDIDLAPGEASTFNHKQLAYLGSRHFAGGNIYNALQFENDPRSLIENAIGGSGDDRMTGNAADNLLSGGAGLDHLFGDIGADRILGDYGRDRLFGGADADVLRGGQDADILEGGAGDDTLYGGKNADTLDGGAGNDLLFGRDDRDTFEFAAGGGSDTIADFQDGTDRIALGAFGFAGAREALSHAEQAGKDVVFTFADGDMLTLCNVELRHLDASDFAL